MVDIFNSCSWEVKNFNVTVLLRQSFFVNTVYHRITHNNTSIRWRKIIIVCFLWLLFVYVSVLKIIALFWFSLFLLFSSNGDLQPVLWRYSSCFSSLKVFSWSSMFLFEGSWLMILFSLNLASESLDLTVQQIVRIRSIACITKVPYFYLHIIVIVLLGIIVQKFINNFIGRVNFCFEKFNFFFKCGNCCFINESFIFFFAVKV